MYIWIARQSFTFGFPRVYKHFIIHGTSSFPRLLENCSFQEVCLIFVHFSKLFHLELLCRLSVASSLKHVSNRFQTLCEDVIYELLPWISRASFVILTNCGLKDFINSSKSTVATNRMLPGFFLDLVFLCPGNYFRCHCSQVFPVFMFRPWNLGVQQASSPAAAQVPGSLCCCKLSGNSWCAVLLQNLNFQRFF